MTEEDSVSLHSAFSGVVFGGGCFRCQVPLCSLLEVGGVELGGRALPTCRCLITWLSSRRFIFSRLRFLKFCLIANSYDIPVRLFLLSFFCLTARGRDAVLLTFYPLSGRYGYPLAPFLCRSPPLDERKHFERPAQVCVTVPASRCKVGLKRTTPFDPFRKHFALTPSFSLSLPSGNHRSSFNHLTIFTLFARIFTLAFPFPLLP